MSNHQLRDIGLSRSEVSFGIVRDNGVFDDSDG